jgi:hypothetical protein
MFNVVDKRAVPKLAHITSTAKPLLSQVNKRLFVGVVMKLNA